MSAFSQLAAKLSQQKGVTDPGGLAASIGRKKYSPGTMQEAAAKKESVQSVLRQRRAKK